MSVSRPTLPVRLYAVLVRCCLPRAFRERHGDHLTVLFQDNWNAERSQRSKHKLMWIFVVETVALLVNSLREHYAALRGSPTGIHGSGTTLSGDRMNSIRLLIQDIKYALRFLRRRPGFTAVAAATLGLGIGANTAIFSVVHAVILKPLPYENEEKLVMVWPELRARGVMDWPASHPDVRDFMQAESYEAVAGVRPFTLTLTGDGWAERVDAGMATPNFLSVLGVRPVVGRLFNDDDAPRAHRADSETSEAPQLPAVILSHGLWQRRFGGDPSIVESTTEIMGATVRVAGVLPRSFELLLPASAGMGSSVDLWIATPIDLQSEVRRSVMWRVLARLRPEVSVGQAQAEMDMLATRLRQEIQLYTDVGFHVNVTQLRDDLVEPVRPLVLALFGAVGFVLLISCANVANLLLVRATTRTREISVRAALGGSRWQLMRQMLSESLVLAMIGVILGLALAHAGIQVLLVLRPANLPRLDSIEISGVVLSFALVSSLAAALLFGIVPAIQGSRTNLAQSLTTRLDSGGTAGKRALQNGMVVLEVALSLILLIGAGLMVRSSAALNRANPGYDPENVLTFQVAAPPGTARSVDGRAAFIMEVRQRISALPGVESVGATRPLPLTAGRSSGRYGTEAALEDETLFRQADYRTIVEGYFESMGTRILAGRAFNAGEYADSIPVVVVDQVLARGLWPNESAVGKKLVVRPSRSEPLTVEVVGVVEHQRHGDFIRDGTETVYFPRRLMSNPINVLTWTVRTANEPLGMVDAIRSEVEAVNPQIPLTDVRTMQSYVDSARAPTRFALTLIGVFGIAAMLLSSVGLYGVLAYAVQQRTAEIGIRMAFGAGRSSILRLVATNGFRLVLTGIGLGLLGAYALTRFMETLLVDVAPTDPITYAAIVGLFLGVAGLACYLPASRATKVDPVETLREA